MGYVIGISEFPCNGKVPRFNNSRQLYCCSIRKGSDFIGLAYLLLCHVKSVGLGLGQLFKGQISDRKKFFDRNPLLEIQNSHAIEKYPFNYYRQF